MFVRRVSSRREETFVFKVLTLNNIAKVGLARLPSGTYAVGNEIADPDAILVRSANLHALDIPTTLKAVGRAGAGVNNIPVAKMSARRAPAMAASQAVTAAVTAGRATRGLYSHVE